MVIISAILTRSAFGISAELSGKLLAISSEIVQALALPIPAAKNKAKRQYKA